MRLEDSDLIKGLQGMVNVHLLKWLWDLYLFQMSRLHQRRLSITRSIKCQDRIYYRMLEWGQHSIETLTPASSSGRMGAQKRWLDGIETASEASKGSARVGEAGAEQAKETVLRFRKRKVANIEHNLTARKPEQVNNPTWQAAKRLGVAHLTRGCDAAQNTKAHKQCQVKYESSYLASQTEINRLPSLSDSYKVPSSVPSLPSQCPCPISGPYYLLPAQGHLNILNIQLSSSSSLLSI